MTPAVPRVALAPGYTISRVLKGGWQLAGGHGPVDRAAALDDMDQFVEAGITTFDCADIYTGVESLIGAYLARVRQRQGAAAAARVQVHTKYVPDLDRLATLTRRDVERAIDRSLTRLGLERLDLVQLHWWDYEVSGWGDVARWLDELRHAGKIRHIGVTNFNRSRLQAILDAGVPVVSHQLQYSVLDRRPAHGMTELCAPAGVGFLCYGALAGGFLSPRFLGQPSPSGPLETRSLVKYRLIIDECGGWDFLQRMLAVLNGIAERHLVSIGVVAMRWVMDQPNVAGLIVGARDTRHIADARRLFALALDDADRAAIARVQADATGPAGDVYDLERIPHGPHAAIMRYRLNAVE